MSVELNNNNMVEQVTSKTSRNIPETSKRFKGYISVYVKRADTGLVEIVQLDKDNLHNTGGVDFLHYQGYTSTGTGSSSSITTATQGSNWMALTTDSAAPSAGDTTLASEISTNGLQRAQCTTRSHTASTNVTTLSITFTASGTFTAVQIGALFNASSTGVMNHEFTFASTNLNSGDQITITVTITGG